MITITITSCNELDQTDRQRFIRWFEKRLAADCRQYHADLLA